MSQHRIRETYEMHEIDDEVCEYRRFDALRAQVGIAVADAGDRCQEDVCESTGAMSQSKQDGANHKGGRRRGARVVFC